MEDLCRMWTSTKRWTNYMKYTFKVTEDNVEGIKEMPAMSFKKLLKSLTTSNPKWNGIIEYFNKNSNVTFHIIKGRKLWRT